MRFVGVNLQTGQWPTSRRFVCYQWLCVFVTIFFNLSALIHLYVREKEAKKNFGNVRFTKVLETSFILDYYQLCIYSTAVQMLLLLTVQPKWKRLWSIVLELDRYYPLDSDRDRRHLHRCCVAGVVCICLEVRTLETNRFHG